LDGSGVLTFKNVAVDAGFANAPQTYQAAWYRFDNNSGESVKLGETLGTETSIQAPSGLPSDGFVRVEISAQSAEHASWATPVQVYFKGGGGNWKLVGFERMQ